MGMCANSLELGCDCLGLIRYFDAHLCDSRGAPLTIKNAKRLYAEIADISGLGVSMTGSVTSGGGGIPGGTESVDFELTRGAQFGIIPAPLAGAGIWSAIDLQSNSPDFVVERLHLASEERTLFGA